MLNYQFERLTESAPIFITKLPREINKEIFIWERECKKIKNHPLSELKAHENIAYSSTSEKYNSYQCSVPTFLIQESFWLAYTIRLLPKFFGSEHRFYHLGNQDGHFDGYDIWANFAYRGDQNPIHRHSGIISGVIYHKNHNHPTVFPEYDTMYPGKNGTMILFPSNFLHYVEPQKSWRERITFAFNIHLKQ